MQLLLPDLYNTRLPCYYDISLKFFKGCIQDALDSAFALSLVKKRRPLLIYIHHERRMSNLFPSRTLVEFIIDNYVVWPWDLSIESNRQILIQIWKEYFPGEPLVDFSMNQCPMLIGVRRQISMVGNSFLKYQPEVLVKDYILVRTNQEFDPDIFLGQLKTFKQEFDYNEQHFSSDFVKKIVACPELVVEIAEYLSLNDAVSTFSIDILPVLWRYNRKLPVIRPSKEFIETMTESNNHDKILSLRLEANQFRRTMTISFSDTFAYVTSLTLINLEKIQQICELRAYFRRLTYLTLRYNGNFDFRTIWKIFDLMPRSIEHFHIYCDSIVCSHYLEDLIFTKIENFNITMKSFALHVNHTSRSLVNGCDGGFTKCILRTTIDFIRIMSKIQDIYIILKESSIDNFLDVIEWVVLLDMCQQLKKIRLKRNKNIQYDAVLAQEIKNELRDKEESIALDIQPE